jgi:hypothetical protein
MPDRPRPDHLAGLGRSEDLLGGSARPDASPPEDAIELWGRRIGRSLAIVAAIVIVILFIANSG